MQPRSALALLPVLAALLLPTAARADSAFCAVGKPESVLACLSAAFQSRDIAAYSRLLAPDFKFHFVQVKTGQPGAGWNREDDVTGVGNLFAAQDVASIQHAITASNPPVQTGPDAWDITGIVTHLTVTKADPARTPFVVDGDPQTFRIRAVATPEPHFEIYEWVDYSN